MCGKKYNFNVVGNRMASHFNACYLPKGVMGMTFASARFP
jgi:hypothetical protein